MAAQSISADHRHTTAEILKLRKTITTMDDLSQEGLSEIAAIARLALARLETPEGYQHLEDIAQALGVIWEKARCTGDSVNYEAEATGCHYVNEHQRLRWDAQQAALEAMGAST